MWKDNFSSTKKEGMFSSLSETLHLECVFRVFGGTI